MPAAGALFALLVVLSIAGTIGLWYAIDSETAAGETMSRDEAERTARTDTADDEAEEAPESHGEGAATRRGVSTSVSGTTSVTTTPVSRVRRRVRRRRRCSPPA
ncbi:hypothetical protein SY89_01676 [Halolamina pelagica]|uniref:Uncharacterized protein n=1 Tax=Halolamina pelagica TaxID=699431 RepID=A0A0P7HBT6_9EURY|nr:hypothetical protein [Halolamina pelagica]KPN30935.1 hypothetical protein SY89_01676 [Halolamina pelagica]